MRVDDFIELVDRLSAGLLGNDFDTYASTFALPATIEPRNATAYVLEDRAALRADFDLYVESLEAQHVTDIIRQVRSIAPNGKGGFTVRYITHIMSLALRLVDPFEAEMQIEQTDSGPRIRHIISSIGHINWTLGKARIGEAGAFDPIEHDDQGGTS